MGFIGFGVLEVCERRACRGKGIPGVKKTGNLQDQKSLMGGTPSLLVTEENHAK